MECFFIYLTVYFCLIRASPHPFITLVISCPESATILIQEVSVLLVNSIKRYSHT